MAFEPKTDKIEDVSGFADRGLDRLRGLFQNQTKSASAERVESPQAATSVREEAPVKIQSGPREVNDRVTIGQHDEAEETGMSWLSNLSANYG